MTGIGEVVERTQTPASTIRYYERIGVLPEPRRISGQRWYDPGVLEELGAIRIAQKLGFQLDEVKTLLAAFRSENKPSGECQRLAEQKLRELDEIISEAQAMKRILEHGLTCNCTTLRGCYLNDAE